MRRFRRGGGGEVVAAVDLSAMIDMVFLLLIFFVVTTSFTRESGVRVRRPESARAVGVGARYVPVAVTRGGTVHAGGRAIGVDDRAGLAAVLAAAGTRHVVIVADRLAPTGVTLAVQDLALSAGATRVDVAAVQR
jgi:biopolymer transport protein ExbD